MGCSEWCGQLQRVVIIGCDSMQQCCVIVCCVAVDERENVHADGKECELCGRLISNREVSTGDSRFHIENHHIQSEEVAVVDIDYYDTVERCS